MNGKHNAQEQVRDLVDGVTEHDDQLEQALGRLSHISRAVSAYVEDARRHLLLAARDPQGVEITFDRWHRAQVDRPSRRPRAVNG